MTDTELIELTKAYVGLSNAHRVNLILPLFAAGALYTSTAVGEHRGRAAIGDMMHGFFTRYPDVSWQASHFRCTKRLVSFDFTMTAIAADDNTRLENRGIEHINFNADGLITKLTVEAA